MKKIKTVFRSRSTWVRLLLVLLCAALPVFHGTFAQAHRSETQHSNDNRAGGTASASDSVLRRDVIVPINVIDRFFPEITREASTGRNLTAVGNPKRTRSVIYANSDSSKKMTISVDQYANSTDASSAYHEAVQKSRMVPGFKPISAANLGRHTFIGTVTQGAETHIGLGSLDGALIMGATLVGYEPTPGNVAKLISLTRSGERAAKAALAEALLPATKERNRLQSSSRRLLFCGPRGGRILTPFL